MRLYGAIEKVEPLDDGTVRVHGTATTEAVDDQGEIVRASAIRDALPDYMKFPALREMHQLAAAGTALEAEVGEDNITRIVAHVVDPVAVSKVKNRVYRGFSIGGRVTAREPGNPRAITGIRLNEISLVDRPANPESVFDCWKAAEMVATPFNPPVQIWSCGLDDHRHLAKNDAMKCQEARKLVAKHDWSGGGATIQVGEVGPEIPEQRQQIAHKAADPKKPYGDVKYADPGYQEDKKKRYPIDTEAHIRAAWDYINKPNNAGQYSPENLSSIKSRIVAAWKAKIDEDGPPSGKAAMADSLRKALRNIPQLVYLCDGLQLYCESLFVERAVEGDDSGQPERLQSIVSDLMQFLRDQVAEDTAEVMEGADADMLAECWAPHAVAMIKTLKNIQGSENIVNEIEKRGMRHNRADQALLDTTAYAVNKAMTTGTAKRAALVHMADAHKAVLDAGAANVGAEGREMLTNSNPTGGTATQNATVDSGRASGEAVPQPGIGGGTNITMVKTAGFAAIDAIEKAGGGHVALLNAAHDLLCSVSDGVACEDGTSRHSAADTARMIQAHDHLTAVDGVQCAAALAAAEKAAAEKAAAEKAAAEKAAAEKAAAEKALTTEPDKVVTEPRETAERAAEKAAAKAADKAENDALAKTIEGIVARYAAPPVDPMMKTFNEAVAALTAKVEGLGSQIGTVAADVVKIKETPLPPVTVARMPPRTAPQLTKDMSTDEFANAFALLSKEDQSLALIKAAHASPMQIKGITDAPAPPGAPPLGR